MHILKKAATLSGNLRCRHESPGRCDVVNGGGGTIMVMVQCGDD